MDKRRKFFSIPDIFIIIFILLISALFFSFSFSKTDKLVCVIREDGEIIHSYNLDDIDDELIITLDNKERVTVKITDEYAQIIQSTCSDKICERTGRIKKAGQSIVCLPAGVSVTLESSVLKQDVDSVVG